MKTYKRLTLITFFAFIAVTFWRVFAPLYTSNATQSWTTYQKSETGIRAEPTSREDKEKMRLPESMPAKSENSERTPASKAPILEREVTGDINQQNLIYENDVNADWQQLMAERLMRFQDENTKMFTRHEKGILQVQKGNAKYLEQVLITFSMDDGTHYSYRALVASDDGKIIETWDRTKHEHTNRFKRPKNHMRPTGSL